MGCGERPPLVARSSVISLRSRELRLSPSNCLPIRRRMARALQTSAREASRDDGFDAAKG